MQLPVHRVKVISPMKLKLTQHFVNSLTFVIIFSLQENYILLHFCPYKFVVILFCNYYFGNISYSHYERLVKKERNGKRGLSCVMDVRAWPNIEKVFILSSGHSIELHHNVTCYYYAYKQKDR